MRLATACIESLEPRRLLSALTKFHGISPQAYGMATVNGTSFFSAADGEHGAELWATNGTRAGTRLVRDIVSGKEGSYPLHFVRFKNTLFFLADGGLWKSDGTEAGTVSVWNPPPADPLYWGDPEATPQITQLKAVGKALFIVTRRSGVLSSDRLWKSDGTAKGTTLIWGPASYHWSLMSGAIHGLTDLGGKLVFAAKSDRYGFELWTSDGTPKGTRLLKDLNRGRSDSHPAMLTRVGKHVYFLANTTGQGTALWKTDGTRAGTQPVKVIYPIAKATRSLSYLSSEPNYRMAVVGRTMFFAANDGQTGLELWKSDGTAQGTQLVKDIYLGRRTPLQGSFHSSLKDPFFFGPMKGSSPRELIAVNDKVFFTATTDQGVELWRSDGTPEGTVLVKDIRPGPGSSSPYFLTSVDRTLRDREGRGAVRMIPVRRSQTV